MPVDNHAVVRIKSALLLTNLFRYVKINWIFLLLAILLLTLRCLEMNRPDILIDDAFISFRYARNFAQGGGLVYNPGERVEGYTNFLWTILLGVFHWLTLDIILSSKILSGLAAIGTLVLIFLIGENLFSASRHKTILISAPMLLFAAIGSQARFVLSGMETLLFTFLLTLSTYLFLYHKRPLLTGVSFAMCAMTRPEGILYYLIAFGFLLFMQRRTERQHDLPIRDGLLSIKKPDVNRSIVHFAIGFLAVYGVYFVWRWSYYGYLLPNTYYVKAAGFSPERLARGWDYLRQVIQQWAILPLLAISWLSFLSIRRNPVWLLFLLNILATLIYFVYLGGDFVVWFGPRFLMPVLPILLLMYSESISNLDRFRLPNIIVHLLQIGLSIFLIVYAYVFSWPSRQFIEVFASQMKSWTEMGRWIATNTKTDATIATDAAGLIPYYSNRYAIDMFGLTDLHISHLDMSGNSMGVVAHEKFDPVYILNRQPDCIVSTWMDQEGNAISSGLDTVRDQLESQYKLVAIAKVRYGPPTDGRWIIQTSEYKPNLFEKGYQTGLFCRPQALHP